MSISRISNALVSGTNENTLALVNFNIDFSLLKLEPPGEFTGLGLSLTRQRRELAEEGPTHRTARRLGALFENVVPDSPALIRAYGSRVSEISQNSPKKDIAQRHGVFAECAGVDGTSIWAAATSGKSAIAIHLLACMLARAWSGPQATSIWVELVEERKRLLKKLISDGLYDSSIQLSLAVSEDLTRTDLAQWDASTRAWLQVADDDQIHRQKQLMLIINNVNIPVNQGDAKLTTYVRVIEAWKTALETLERLFAGQSQRIMNGAVLLGLSSWHLYPNLLVLAEQITTVKFDDPVIEHSGQLTIGLQNPNADTDEGVYWSLSLAHLRFYGDPVKVTSFTTRDGSRLSIEEFQFLVLGSILSDWGSLYTSDFTQAAGFFKALASCVQNAYSHEPLDTDFISWINILGNASQNFLKLKETERSIASSIIALGHRRGRDLLCHGVHRPPPMMGLCHPWIQHLLQSPLSHETDEKVALMRFIAHKLDLRHDRCIIGIKDQQSYVTAIQHVEKGLDGDPPRSYHIRWVERTWRLGEETSCSCHELGHSCHRGRCPCLRRGIYCTDDCHREVVDSQTCPGCDRNRNNYAPVIYAQDGGTLATEAYGCENLVPGEAFRYVERPFFQLMSPGLPDRSRTTPQQSRSGGLYQATVPCNIRLSPASGPGPKKELCPCFYATKSVHRPTFTLIAGSQDGVGLFLRTDVGARSDRQKVTDSLERAHKEPLSSIEDVTRMLETGKIRPRFLVDYLDSLHRGRLITLPIFRKGISMKSFNVQAYLRSLHVFSLAINTYKELPGSTISLNLISSPLHNAAWAPGFETRSLTRQQKFACIAMLESGTYNIDPKELRDVIAISSRNSIFVSRLLLEDPATTDHVNDISRVVGNVGKTGMVLMVAPQAPRLRKAELDDFRLVTHAHFDGRLEDSFKATSLHLRFTEFEMAFNVGERGAIDKDLCLVETLVQVFERDKWVADIDVLPLIDKNNDLIRRSQINCNGCSRDRDLPQRLRSVDNWEELLDAPEGLGRLNVGIFRAHDNWLARLAAACICLQKGYRTVINPTKATCWRCSCGKSWGWSPATVMKSDQAARRDAYGDRDDDSSDLESDVSDSSDISETPEIPELSESEESSDSQPVNISADTEPIMARPFQFQLRPASLKFGKPLRGIDDDGYESDDTAVLAIGSYEENDERRGRLPQIFII